MRRLFSKLALLALGAAIATPLARAEDAPIKALLICGGCCHDYAHQKDVLPKGISARANVEWTVAYDPSSGTDHLNPVYKNKDWYKGFDVIVHDECCATVVDMDTIQNVILKPHADGLPGVMLHCAEHSYRTAGWDKKQVTPWFEFTGMQSTHHRALIPIEITFTEKENEIIKGMADWTTMPEELYNNEVGHPLETAHALARGKQTSKDKAGAEQIDDDVVIWTNLYKGKAKVFATTLGHQTKTVGDDRYLDLVARGLLWSVGKLDADHLKPAKKVFIDGPESSAAPVKAGPAMEDVARGKTATASSSQEGNSPDQAFDNIDSSRWCAAGSSMPQWLQVDLGKPQDLTGARISWEFDGKTYKYKLSGSADGKAWQTLADETQTKSLEQVRENKFDAKGIRYVKLEVTGGEDGAWASVTEFNVFGTKPAGAAQANNSKRPDSKILGSVKGPKGYDVTVFAAPPDASYVTCLAAAPNGEVFIGVDKDGSLGHDANAGRVVRAIDTDGDGKADKFTTFAVMDHPRGLIWDDGKLYVLHPPILGVFEDKGDGTAGPEKILIDGISTPSLVQQRGADHTTNGIRLGIDGWIYIAMGDFGALKATGPDGKTFQEHGGGIMRVRPDGTDLEVYSHGHRNIYDVSIDPLMNVFTRDNTNDGDAWNDRLAYIIPTGYYGYPSYFVNFKGEYIDCLADYGGGSPCGSIFIDEPGIAGGFYTVEWGNSEVDHHPLTATGAGFKAGMEKFMSVSRGTDIDVDGSSHLYVSSWANGGFAYSGPNVGFVVRATPVGLPQSPPFPDQRKASANELVQGILSPSAVHRQAAQREILRRNDPALAEGLTNIARSDAPISYRAAAIFTLKLLYGGRANDILANLTERDDVREFALRALADKKSDADVPLTPFIKALTDTNPRVRLTAAWGLARLNRPEAINPLLPLLADGDPLVAHVAMQSLVTLHAVDGCLGVISDSHADLVQGAVRVLQHIHEPSVVEGLIKQSQSVQSPALKQQIFGGLARLYHKEADWDGQWWGTRPDTTGPYYKPVSWDSTSRIGAALVSAMNGTDSKTLQTLVTEVQRNGVDAAEVTTAIAEVAKTDPAIRAIVVDSLASRRGLSNEQLTMLKPIAISADEPAGTRVKAIRALQRAGDAGNATAMEWAITALAGIVNSENADPALSASLNEFIHDTAHAARINDFAKLAEAGDAGAKRELGYAVLLNLSTSRLIKPPQRQAAQAVVDKALDKPGTAIALLRAVGLTKNKDYAAKVIALKSDPRPAVAQTAEEVATLIGGNVKAGGTLIEELQYEAVVSAAQKDKGDAKLGAELFQRQGCIACHTTSTSEAPKGPMLAGITGRYNRGELCESILKPGAKIAQGFETQWFKTAENGDTLEGFVTRESGDELELRNAAGVATVLKKADIKSRGKRETSIMPEGLVAKLTPHDLASILAFLESLQPK